MLAATENIFFSSIEIEWARVFFNNLSLFDSKEISSAPVPLTVTINSFHHNKRSNVKDLIQIFENFFLNICTMHLSACSLLQ